MNNLKEMEAKKQEILSNLTKEELENYIQVLTREYYLSCLANDVNSYKNNLNCLKEVLTIFNPIFNNISNYINFCLLCNINKILMQELNLDFELAVFNDVELTKSDGNISSLSEEELEKLFNYDLKLMKELIKDKEVNLNG